MTAIEAPHDGRYPRTTPNEMWTTAGPVVSGMPAEAVEELQERAVVINSAFQRRVLPLLSRA
jgi:hypothetical protein